ncbi:MAG: Hsp20/alpha crystallin family protein [Kiritimatiellia bacterium]
MTNKVFLQWCQIRRKVGGVAGHALDSNVPDVWAPNTDVFESAEGVVIRVELAGVPLEQLEITCEGRVLNINGTRCESFGSDTLAGFRFRQLEIEYGPFHRSVTLPYDTDPVHTKATMKNGVLEIRVRAPHAGKKSGAKKTGKR